MGIFLALFFKLQHLMRKHHHYEYQKLKRERVVQAYFYCSVFILFEQTASSYLSLSIMKNMPSGSRYCYCNCFNLKSMDVVYHGLYVIEHILFAPQIFYIFIIAYLKSSDDILQGVSKLDYLIKVSIF
mmetsp:Transcript_17273/g.29087  ORF Transcript_17273/g.29087 Transcript_17273/m.29087 type:complete len:128 (-) Transcript_17273:144-527(-)|eukprot:CAMPEP_0168610456 /NCGR_PEP_ID=MMETSP0449_2-20121227/1795_1 /TAXON_ID=1082188 /ORGANISM="Strombidium rassoulzadegani, Strain ras09" /LENGTH=127 /DNA_ID=CAMNT_0008650759 /DNA_START=248 /DNA_END=631 /DNA_ORIENTATION=-